MHGPFTPLGKRKGKNRCNTWVRIQCGLTRAEQLSARGSGFPPGQLGSSVPLVNPVEVPEINASCVHIEKTFVGIIFARHVRKAAILHRDIWVDHVRNMGENVRISTEHYMPISV